MLKYMASLLPQLSHPAGLTTVPLLVEPKSGGLNRSRSLPPCFCGYPLTKIVIILTLEVIFKIAFQQNKTKKK
jgi:hypothetical protein